MKGRLFFLISLEADHVSGKLRPALVLRSLPGSYNDWLICMITTRLYHENAGIDEVIKKTDQAGSKLKKESVVYKALKRISAI